MNFEGLNIMINNLIQGYKCPECQWNITAHDIDIVWAAWSTVNLDVVCTNCGKHSMIKSQIMHINQEQIKALQNKVGSSKKSIIKDNQIVELSKDLKHRKVNVSDILSD